MPGMSRERLEEIKGKLAIADQEKTYPGWAYLHGRELLEEVVRLRTALAKAKLPEHNARINTIPEGQQPEE